MVYEFSRDKETWDGVWTDHITCNAAYYSDLPDNRLEVEEKDSWWLECAGVYGTKLDRIIGVGECISVGCSEEYEIWGKVSGLSANSYYHTYSMFRVDNSDGSSSTPWHTQIELDKGTCGNWGDIGDWCPIKIEGCSMADGTFTVTF